MSTADLLIIEDNGTKQLEIEKALATGDYKISAVRTIANAYRVLVRQRWDLIILDMTFQVGSSSGFEKEPLAGLEVLQFMANQRFPTPVIVATQHSSFSNSSIEEVDSIEQLHELLVEAFPVNYRQTVEVDLSEDAWKETLRMAVERALGEGGE